MQKNLQISILLSFLLCFSNCKNSNLKECFRGTGEADSIEYKLNRFTEINLYDEFDVYLIDDSIHKIKIVADEKYIDKIHHELKDTILSIRSERMCEFMKSQDISKKVYIHAPNLNFLFVHGSHTIFSEDTLAYDRFLLRIYGKIAFVDIKVKCFHFFLEQWSATGDYHVEGETVYYSILNHGYSYIYSDELIADYIHINHRSTGDIYVSANNSIEVYLNETGDVIYNGNPDISILEQTSSGRIYQKNQ